MKSKIMATSELFLGDNQASYKYESIGEYKRESIDDKHNQALPESNSASDIDVDVDVDVDVDYDVNCNCNNNTKNENALLLPSGGIIESDDDEDPDQQQAQLQKLLDYRHQNRFIILALIALTPTGVKFFKAAQSSFQEYFMNDPQLLMSATTYSMLISLMSLPVATLFGGALLDYKPKKQKQKHQRKSSSRIGNWLRNPISSNQSCLGSSRTPAYSAIGFAVVSFLGILLYGYGLETMNSVPIGLVGATIFGLGEGCVVVASRTFVAHAFYGSDGAFAQGVLVAMNNIAMMSSKISLPWLIENEKNLRSITTNCFHNISLECLDDENYEFDHNMTMTTPQGGMVTSDDPENQDNNIWIGIVACCMVQLMSLTAGILYAWWFGLSPPPQNLQLKPQEPGQPSKEKSSTGRKVYRFTESSMVSRAKDCFQKLPLTFWIVAIGRAIFVVVFKVFTRNSNSILMEKFGVSAVAAGRKSSFHELFALGSPVVGFIAYRSPGGIVPVLLFAAALASVSIATLACVPAAIIQLYLPGGALTPMIGISIAHGIFIPICMAIIPQTCSPEQLGMAFAVVEVLGSVLNLTNILFGWLRDATGKYEVPMEMLLAYTLVGMCLLWMSRNHIRLQQPSEQKE